MPHTKYKIPNTQRKPNFKLCSLTSSLPLFCHFSGGRSLEAS
ncbi:MAG: hypothetical protein V7K98_17130 [Nostoc sp.]